MLLPFGRDKLVVFPNPVLELWAYVALFTKIVDANDDVSKTNASIATVKTGRDIFLGNCTSVLIDLYKIWIISLRIDLS